MKEIKIYRGYEDGYSAGDQSDIEDLILQRFSKFAKDKNCEVINIQTVHKVSDYGTHSTKMYIYYYERD